MIGKKILMLAVMCLSCIFVGCGGTAADNDSGGVASAAKQQEGTSVKQKKILVAYYSLTNTTKRAAESIQAQTGGDIFEIQAANPYPKEHDPCLERDMQEIKDNARPAVANKVENMADYDVIFVGYPIWYYQAPMLINTFLESYDLSGKTVVPFCTSGGYPIDDSIDKLKVSMPGAKVAEGLRIDDDGEMSDWLKRLGLTEVKK